MESQRASQYDFLKLQQDAEYNKIVPFETEAIVFSDYVVKINSWGIKQERILLMTTQNIYNFKKKHLKRKIPIQRIGGIIFSEKHKNDIVLHIPTEYDYRYTLDRMDDFVRLLKERFQAIYPQGHLKVYLVPGNLKEYTTTEKDMKYGLTRAPGSKFRQRQEDVGIEQKKLAFNNAGSAGSVLEEEKRSGSSTVATSEGEDPEDEGSPAMGAEGDIPNRQVFDNGFEGMIASTEEFTRESILLYKNENDMGHASKLSDFKIIALVGKGTFGKVYLAKLESHEKLYAVKSMRKDLLIDTKQIEGTKLEKEILLNCNHPFLSGMDYMFQTEERLYFVMEFIRGGEVYKHFMDQKRFPEAQVKFYAAQIALGIGYLHDKNIVHRDLKLENIMIDETGYLKLIDFGLAKIIDGSGVAMSFCGTPEYLAPEMITQKGHDKNIDWWGLGILIYEMLVGVTPFFSRSRNNLLRNIKNAKVIFPDRKKYKIQYSDEFMDIVMKLLAKDKTERLGFGAGAEEVLDHPWFKDIELKLLFEKKLKPPFKPKIADNEVLNNFKPRGKKDEIKESLIPQNKLSKIKNYEKEFSGF